MALAIFGIGNDGLNLAVSLLILFLVVLWLALVAFTYFDANRRIEDSFLVGCATVASLIFPFLGTFVYSILRPPEFLADAHERDLEVRASELRLRQLEESSCPNCEHPVERTYLRCPNCRARIKDPCESCGKPIDPRWSICPYCETPTRRATAQRRAASSSQRSAASKQRSAAPPSSRPSRAKRSAPVRSEEPRPVAKRSAATRRSQATRSRPERPGEDGPRTAPAR